MSNLLLKLLVVLSIVLIVRSVGQKCRHKEYQKKVEIKKMNVRGESNRFLQDAPWESIRIYVDYTRLESQNGDVSDILISNLKEVTDQSVIVLEKLIKVKRIPQPLIVESCYDDTNDAIGSDVKLVGIEADLILFPYFDLSAPDD